MERPRTRAWALRVLLAAVAAIGVVAPAASAAVDGQRAYELVTPPDSVARVEVFGSFGLADGNSVIFSSFDSLPGAVPNGPLPTSDSWIARRGPSGWATEWITDAPLSEPGNLGSQTVFSNEDGSVTIMTTETGIDPADDFAHSVDPYIRTADGTITWLAPGTRTGIEFRFVEVANDDLSRLLISAGQPLLPDDDLDVSDDLYIWEDGTLRLITPGTPGQVGVPNMGGSNASAFPSVMSDDGSRVFFETNEALSAADTDGTKWDIYVRENDAYRLVSVDRRATPGTIQTAPALVGAASDGSVACFQSRVQLEDADTDTQEDIYCYDLEADVLERVSSGLNDNVTTPVKAVAVSDDGSVVFMSAAAALTADDVDGVTSLFRRSGGVTEYVGPLDPTDLTQERRVASPFASHRALLMNAAGTELVFTSAAKLAPTDTDAQPDVYRWEQGSGFTQISISSEGGNAELMSATGAYEPAALDSFNSKKLRGSVITADGEAIFFESADALVGDDIDGGFLDVYEWREGGEVRLVSPPGAFPGDAFYIDNSADGETVFFATPEAISGQDTNGGVRDLYAARVGGGFAEPVPPSSCIGDGCQGALTPPPAIPQPGSSSLSGRGNAVELRQSSSGGKKCGKGKRKVRRNGKVRCVPKKGKRAAKGRKTKSKAKGGSNR